MVFWSLPEETSGASQPAAFLTKSLNVAHPQGDNVVQCIALGLVSFNFGIEQAMLTSKRWNTTHIYNFRDLLVSLGHAGGNDFVFGSEVGAVRKGLSQAQVDYEHVVQDALPAAACSTNGAYLHIWNVRHQSALLKASGTWTADWVYGTDMHWQAYDLLYGDAVQLAGLVVGNMHIPCGSAKKAPPLCVRRGILERALTALSSVHVDDWQGRQNFSVMRVLVGDCNLSKQEAQAATQKAELPLLTESQHATETDRWQVCDVPFPRQALESARKQNP